MRGCRLRNLASWLSVRERGRTILRHPFSEVPEKLQIPIDSIVDEHEHLKGAVVLGWTHSGSCLISYTSSPVPAADGKDGHHVQLWRFHPFQRIARLCNVPVFRRYTSAPWGDGLHYAARSLLVTVWAAPDDSVLVVHGAAVDYIDPVEEFPMCPVTVISGLTACDDEMALQVVHFDYCPQQRELVVQPALQLSPLGTLVLAGVHGIICFQFSVDPAEWQHTDSEVRVGLKSIGTAKHMHIFSGSLARYGCNIVKTEVGLTWHEDSFQTEPFLQEWMLSNLPGHQLYDYDLQFVVLLPPTAAASRDPAPPAGTAAACEYDFIGSDAEDDYMVTPRSGALGSLVVLIAAAARRLSAAGISHPPAAATRIVCLLVDIDLAAGKSEVLSAAEASPQPQQDVRSIAVAHAIGWRRRFASPQDVQRLPSVLSNASVLATGQSVEQLRHPWLPMCLTGYKAAAQLPT